MRKQTGIIVEKQTTIFDVKELKYGFSLARILPYNERIYDFFPYIGKYGPVKCSVQMFSNIKNILHNFRNYRPFRDNTERLSNIMYRHYGRI